MTYRVLALSAFAAAVFSACSSGGGTATPNVPQSAPSVAPTTAPTAAPTAGAQALSNATFATAARGPQVGFAAPSGFAVYDFDLDLSTPGMSGCTGTCATFWPPLVPPAGVTLVAPWGFQVRADGTHQLTYSNHPLYTYAQDTAAATASGDGLNVSGGVWHLASASALAIPLTAPTSSPPPSAPNPY
jgi:predicted lipoprotein with Yx(FWY)xxD motif